MPFVACAKPHPRASPKGTGTGMLDRKELGCFPHASKGKLRQLRGSLFLLLETSRGLAHNQPWPKCLRHGSPVYKEVASSPHH